ncbi:hypothetical protein ACFLRT_01030, partial [Acidobacteriota bacterium]
GRMKKRVTKTRLLFLLPLTLILTGYCNNRYGAVKNGYLKASGDQASSGEAFVLVKSNHDRIKYEGGNILRNSSTAMNFPGDFC